jgi:hypothetical protein
LGKSGRRHCRSRICARVLGLWPLYRPRLSLRQHKAGGPASGFAATFGASSINRGTTPRSLGMASAFFESIFSPDTASYRGGGRGGMRMEKYLRCLDDRAWLFRVRPRLRYARATEATPSIGGSPRSKAAESNSALCGCPSNHGRRPSGTFLPFVIFGVPLQAQCRR